MNNLELSQIAAEETKFQYAAEFPIEEPPVDPGLELAANELGVSPKELREVDTTQMTKKEATTAVFGEQKFVGGRIVDPDGGAVLDKMRLAGNVSVDAVRKQQKLETDLLLFKRSVSDRFLWEGKVMVTVTELVDRKSGSIKYTTIEVDPNKQSAVELQSYPVAEPGAPLEADASAGGVAKVVLPESTSRMSSAETGTSFTGRLQKEASPEHELRLRPELIEARAAEIISPSPERLSPTLSPEAAINGELVTTNRSFSPPPQHREVLDSIKDPTGIITMTRYKNKAAA